MGEIITFYSYKGGVGRTMALANVGVLLARWGYSVLLVDWDLEAPGLEFYFQEYLKPKTEYKKLVQKQGVIDLLYHAIDDDNLIDWRECVSLLNLGVDHPSLDLISAGRRRGGREQYLERVRGFDFSDFYEEGGGRYVEELRNEWKEAYDFVLIDSRTGITDIGGVCTIQMPDKLVVLFTANDQSLNGILEVTSQAIDGRKKIPFDRRALVTIPIPTRFENSERTLSRDWLARFAVDLEPLYAPWLPEKIDRNQMVEITKVPYIPFYNFGERLPVIEEGTSDPLGLGYAFETLAAMLANDLQNINDLLTRRDSYVVRVSDDTPSARFFLSYSRKDKKTAQMIINALSEAGIHVRADTDILDIGEEWQTEITNAIQESAGVIVLISKHSRTSKFVQEEISFAEMSNKLILPIRLDNSEVPENLLRYQYIDFADTPIDLGLQRLISATQSFSQR